MTHYFLQKYSSCLRLYEVNDRYLSYHLICTIHLYVHSVLQGNWDLKRFGSDLNKYVLVQCFIFLKIFFLPTAKQLLTLLDKSDWFSENDWFL
jgi:hypothetical protein